MTLVISLNRNVKRLGVTQTKTKENGLRARGRMYEKKWREEKRDGFE